MSLFFLSWSLTSGAEEMPVLDCIVTPSITIDVSSPVPGTLAEVAVDRSDIVAQGQVIARLNSEVEQATVALARAKAALDSEVNLGEVNLMFDERKHKRFDSLYVNDVASSQDKDEAERNMALSKEKLKHSRELRKLRKLELQKAEAQLKQKSIRSPIQGVVVQRYKSASEHVEEEAIVRIAQFNPLYVEAIVPIEQFGQINSGMQADVFFEVFNETPQRATVTVVDQMGDAASGTFGVRLELPNPENKLPAGLKCNVKILSDYPVKQAEDSESNDEVVQQNNNLETLAEIAGGDVVAINLTDTPSIASCSSIGPFVSSSEAQQLVGLLQDQGLAPSVLTLSQERSPRFIVLAPNQESREQSNQLMARMKDAGIQDLAMMWRGRYKHRISLGVYGKEITLKKRVNLLAQLDFETEVVELSQQTNKWWVDVNYPLSNSERTVLTKAHPQVMAGKQSRPLACSEQLSRTASR